MMSRRATRQSPDEDKSTKHHHEAAVKTVKTRDVLSQGDVEKSSPCYMFTQLTQKDLND